MIIADRDDILSLVPHQGDMCLWDAVLSFDASSIQLQALNHRNPTHPLRSHGRLRAVHLCEYGAQAMAVHGGLLARAAGGRAKAGLLVALRAVELHVARIDTLSGPLLCTANVVTDGDNSWQYAFRISHRDDAGETQLLAEGRAAVVLQG